MAGLWTGQFQVCTAEVIEPSFSTLQWHRGCSEGQGCVRYRVLMFFVLHQLSLSAGPRCALWWSSQLIAHQLALHLHTRGLLWIKYLSSPVDTLPAVSGHALGQGAGAVRCCQWCVSWFWGRAMHRR